MFYVHLCCCKENESNWTDRTIDGNSDQRRAEPCCCFWATQQHSWVASLRESAAEELSLSPGKTVLEKCLLYSESRDYI